MQFKQQRWCNTFLLSFKTLHCPCSITKSRPLWGVVILWWMSWKCLETIGTHQFPSGSDRPAVQRQEVGIPQTQTLTRTLFLSVVFTAQTIILFDCVLLRRSWLCKPVQRLPQILLFFQTVLAPSFLSLVNKAHATPTQPLKQTLVQSFIGKKYNFRLSLQQCSSLQEGIQADSM